MHVANGALRKSTGHSHEPLPGHTSDEKVNEEDEGKLSQTNDSGGVMPCLMRSESTSSRAKGTLAKSAVLLPDHLRRPWVASAVP
jgi:hypothetical protein